MKKLMVFLGITLCVNMLFAGGLSLSGVGTRAISMGGAMRGLADDNTAIYWNPAGLSFLDESTFTLTAATINSYGEIVNSEDEKFENEPKMYAFPNLSYAPKANSKFNYGFAFYVPYGLGSEWDIKKPLSESMGAASVVNTDGQEITTFPVSWGSDLEKFDTVAELSILDFHTAMSYRLNDQLSFGFGLSLYYGDINMKKVQIKQTNVPNPYAPETEIIVETPIELELEGTGITYGANFGVIYKLNEKLQLGLSGKIPTSIKLKGESTVTAHLNSIAIMSDSLLTEPLSLKSNPDIEAEMNLPGDIGFGFSYKITPTWLVSADFTYTTWKDLDIAPIEFDGNDPLGKPMSDSEIVMEWDNTIRFSVGGENLFNNFAFRYGYYFDQSPIPETTLSPTWPDINDKHSLNFGAGYTYNKFQFDYGFEYIKFTERKVEEDNTPENYLGTYNVDIIAMNFGITYKF
jgi:long-chain fatty acid transport protein